MKLDCYTMRFIHLRKLASDRTLNCILIADIMIHVINLSLINMNFRDMLIIIAQSGYSLSSSINGFA